MAFKNFWKEDTDNVLWKQAEYPALQQQVRGFLFSLSLDLPPGQYEIHLSILNHGIHLWIHLLANGFC